LHEAANEVYRAALKVRAKEDAEIEAAKRSGEYPSDKELHAEYLDALDEAIDWTIGSEIDDYCKRIGISSKPRTETYRKIGIEFLKAQIAAGGSGAYFPLADRRCLRGKYGGPPPLPPPFPPPPPPPVPKPTPP